MKKAIILILLMIGANAIFAQERTKREIILFDRGPWAWNQIAVVNTDQYFSDPAGNADTLHFAKDVFRPALEELMMRLYSEGKIIELFEIYRIDYSDFGYYLYITKMSDANPRIFGSVAHFDCIAIKIK